MVLFRSIEVFMSFEEADDFIRENSPESLVEDNNTYIKRELLL